MELVRERSRLPHNKSVFLVRNAFYALLLRAQMKTLFIPQAKGAFSSLIFKYSTPN